MVSWLLPVGEGGMMSHSARPELVDDAAGAVANPAASLNRVIEEAAAVDTRFARTIHNEKLPFRTSRGRLGIPVRRAACEGL